MKFINKPQTPIILFIIFLVSLSFGLGGPRPQNNNNALFEFHLASPFDDPDMEYSSLAWHGEFLVLLPQYPDGEVLYIKRSELAARLDKKDSSSIVPIKVPINDRGLRKLIQGYEGFEAIIYAGNKVFISIEAETREGLKGFLIQGEFLSFEEGIVLDHSSLISFNTPVHLDNMAYESIIIWDNKIIPIYEANGTRVNPDPFQPVFNMDLIKVDSIAIDALEYRITDATEVDDQGRFWVINYLWTGDTKLLKPGPDQLVRPEAQKGINKNIERLVEYQIHENKISLTGKHPLWITNPDIVSGDNWEGIVRFGANGFIIATDKHQRTILAYVSI